MHPRNASTYALVPQPASATLIPLSQVKSPPALSSIFVLNLYFTFLVPFQLSCCLSLFPKSPSCFCGSLSLTAAITIFSPQLVLSAGPLLYCISPYTVYLPVRYTFSPNPAEGTSKRRTLFSAHFLFIISIVFVTETKVIQ